MMTLAGTLLLLSCLATATPPLDLPDIPQELRQDPIFCRLNEASNWRIFRVTRDDFPLIDAPDEGVPLNMWIRIPANQGFEPLGRLSRGYTYSVESHGAPAGDGRWFFLDMRLTFDADSNACAKAARDFIAQLREKAHGRGASDLKQLGNFRLYHLAEDFLRGPGDSSFGIVKAVSLPVMVPVNEVARTETETEAVVWHKGYFVLLRARSLHGCNPMKIDYAKVLRAMTANLERYLDRLPPAPTAADFAPAPTPPPADEFGILN